MPLIQNPTTLTTSEILAEEIVTTMITRVNAALAEFTSSLAWSLARTWQPDGCTPQQVIAAMGINGGALFAQSAAAVAYLWADADRRAEFLVACQAHNLEVQVVEGLPVFPARQATTTSPDGTVTLA
jgi:hypothetical protein